MSRPILAILLIAAATALATLFVGLRNREGSNSGDLLDDRFLLPFPTSTFTPFQLEEEQYKRRAIDGIYRVEYEQRDAAGKVVETSRVFQLGERFRREEYTAAFDQIPNQKFTIDGREYRCGYEDTKTCMSAGDLEAKRFGEQYLPIFPYGMPNDHGDEKVDIVSIIKTVQAELDLTATPTPMATILPSTNERAYKDQFVFCFVENDGYYFRESCYTKDGIQVLERERSNGGETTKEAVEISRNVTQADFTLPYPVTEPTQAPTSPVSPPSAEIADP